MNKTGTRISVGENSQAQQPIVQDLPQHVAQIQMAPHTEEQEGWDSGKDGWTSGSAKPPLKSPFSSSSSTNEGLCNTTLELPHSWV